MATPPLAVYDPAEARADGDGWLRVRWPDVQAPPHAFVGLRIAHPFAPRERYLREGWQSWSTPTYERLGAGLHRRAAAGPPRYGRRYWLADPPYAGDESCFVWRSQTATALMGPGAGVWVADPDGLVLVREAPADGRLDDVWFAPHQAEDAELAARLDVARPPAEPHVGWSTWDAYGTALTAADLRTDLAVARRRFAGLLDVVNVDDGWQRAVGDWRPRDAAMAAALAAVTEDHALSLWWAPFVVDPASDVARERPEWILRDTGGAPVVVLSRRTMWDAWVLDLTRDDVVEHLATTARSLAALGATLLKADFLYAAEFVADAVRAGHPSPLTGDALYRRALAALRVPGVHLDACGAPTWPSAGLVELLRVGPDVGRRWRHRARAGMESEHEGGSLVNTWEAAKRRAWLHRTLWLNDPDSVFVRDGALEHEWTGAWLDWVSRHGLPMMLSDPLRDLDAEQRRQWAAAVERWRAHQASDLAA